ncbi:hypothetical protein [Pedosphaera parvula]|uniref:Uncharacterized protein n=1 Tax=Pedosphaera parvula (strain Ellin514) TaxID=320771 RepID=B9XDD5_PEDPL|nr:hypothetical protein [Pedosphaera parvula]EEF62081.1 hypothetical protein Cflav_PD6356 [Pedosphaera parvula Ellin514]
MKNVWKTSLVLTAIFAASALAQSTVAQTNNDSTVITATSNALQPVLDGIAGKYGWVATVLIVIGTLRILLKPVMTAIENAVTNDPARLAALQKFEAGPIFAAVAFALDLGASIKLPHAVVVATVPKSIN